MKRSIKYISIIAIAVIIAACMEILSFTHPDSAKVDTTVDANIKVKISMNKDIDQRTTFLMGVLAPVSWDLSKNAVITYSSPNMPGEGAVSNLKMRLATPSDLSGGKEWGVVMKEKLGNRNNYEPVEWIVFIAEKDHLWKGGDVFEGTIDIKFKTGTENIRTNLSYFIGNTADGVHSDNAFYLLQDKLFETTDGSNALIDYTMPKIAHMSPQNFTWEDIVRFNFDATVTVDDVESALKDADEVYFMARATYNDGASTVVVDEISTKTRMLSEGKNKWFLYMYPHEYFAIPAGTKIEKIEFYLVNKDKSIEVLLPNGDEFLFLENCPK